MDPAKLEAKQVKMTKYCIGMLLLAMLFAGCGERGSSPTGFTGEEVPRQLVGVDWELVSFEMDGNEDPITDGNLYTLTVHEDSTASGFAHCNLYGGPVVFDDQNFRFLQIASTLALCTGPSRGTEFLNALETVQRYEIRQGRLRMFYDNNSSVLNFEPYRPQ